MFLLSNTGTGPREEGSPHSLLREKPIDQSQQSSTKLDKCSLGKAMIQITVSELILYIPDLAIPFDFLEL